MVQDNLVQYLPSDLDNAFLQTMSTGETTLLSLPGAMGEALAVTSSRIVIIRDKGPNAGIEVFSYPLVKVTDVGLGSSTTGGMLVIETPEKVDDEKRTVYFASYDKTIFESAVERIKGLISVARMAVGNGRPAAPAVPDTTGTATLAGIPRMTCSACGGEIDERDAFCPACGENVRGICQVCSGTMPVGAKHCPSCGSEAKLVALQCYACGERANSAVMSYCPQCGTSLSPKCASCGAAVIMGWPRCRYCGREIGSEGMPGRGMYVHRQRELEEQAKASSRVEEIDKTSEDVYIEGKQSPAETHNARGAEYFEKDMVDEAIEEFRRAVALEPDNSYYHCNLAAAYDEDGQSDEARREYERTLELNPNDVTALLYLGYILNETDDSWQAASLWRRVINVAPGTPEAEEAQQNLNAQKSL